MMVNRGEHVYLLTVSVTESAMVNLRAGRTSSKGLSLSFPIWIYRIRLSHRPGPGCTIFHLSLLLILRVNVGRRSPDGLERLRSLFAAASLSCSFVTLTLSPMLSFGAPPHRGFIVHHLPSPGLISTSPSRARSCAARSIDPTSRTRSHVSPMPSPGVCSGARKIVSGRHCATKIGPSRIPFLASCLSLGDRVAKNVCRMGKSSVPNDSRGGSIGRDAWHPKGHAAISVNARTVSSRISSGISVPAPMRRPLYFFTNSGSLDFGSCVVVVIVVVVVVVAAESPFGAVSTFMGVVAPVVPSVLLSSGDFGRS